MNNFKYLIFLCLFIAFSSFAYKEPENFEIHKENIREFLQADLNNHLDKLKEGLEFLGRAENDLWIDVRPEEINEICNIIIKKAELYKNISKNNLLKNDFIDRVDYTKGDAQLIFTLLFWDTNRVRKLDPNAVCKIFNPKIISSKELLIYIYILQI